MKMAFVIFLLFFVSGYSFPAYSHCLSGQSEYTPNSPVANLANSFNRKRTAQKALQQAEEQYKNRISLQSDSLLQIALKYYNNQDRSEELAKTYFYLGCYYSDQKLTDNAIAAFIKAENAIPLKKDTVLRKAIYDRMEQLKARSKTVITEDVQWRHRYKAAQEDAGRLEIQRNRWRSATFILGGILITILLLFRYRWSQRKKELFESQLFIEKLQRAEDDLKEKLSIRLHEKDNKLKDFFQQRVVQIKDFIELSRKYGSNYEKLKNKFNAMVSTDSFSSSDWLLLREGVNIMDYGIIDYLEKAYPDLTEENIRYCSLICAGFETDELAILWDINSDSIYKRRTRLRQKLGLGKTQDPRKFFEILIENLRSEQIKKMS